MSDSAEGRRFVPGRNIAIKVPVALFDAAVSFYRDAVGLVPVESEPGSQGFEFAGMRLWLDRVAHATHSEVWLELATDDVAAGAEALASAGARVADEIEPLGGRDAHWIIDPGGTVLLLSTHAGVLARQEGPEP